MESRIDVSCDPAGDGWTCHVTVTEGGTTTRAGGEPGQVAGRDDLVRRSFEFLLRREAKESILRAFELPVIGRYFPEYERSIRQG